MSTISPEFRTEEPILFPKTNPVFENKSTPSHGGIIIYSCAGVGSFILALIIILLCYCILKRKLNDRNNITSNLNNQNFNFGNILDNKDSICYEISIKVLIPWSEVYNNHDSVEYLKLKSCVEASIANLYVNHEAFKYAILISLREGSVIANIQLTFASFTKYPLKVVKDAVFYGKLFGLDVDRSFFLEYKVNDSSEILINSKLLTVDVDNMGYKSSSSQSSLHDHIESGYGSQTFESSTLPKKQNLIQSYSADSLRSNHSNKNSMTSTVLKDKNINLKDTLKSLNNLVKKQNIKKTGTPHVGLFNFLPQDDKDLAFKQGEVIYVDYVDNGGWAKATNQNGLKGWIPQNFVVPIDLEQYEHTKKAVESILYLDSVIDSITSPEDSSIQLAKDHDKCSDDFEKPYESSEYLYPPKSIHFITKYPFEPCEQNELKLDVGDLVDVLKTSETGWWKGRCLRTECDGWFPSTYVQPLHLSTSGLYEKESGDDRGTVSDSEIQMIDAITIKEKYEDAKGYNSDNGGCNDKVNELKKEFAKDYGNPSNFLMDKAFKTDPPSKPVPPKPRKRHIQDKLTINTKIEERSQLCNNTGVDIFIKQTNIEDKKMTALKSEKDFLSPIDKIRPRSFQDTPQNHFFKLSDRLNNNMKPAWSLPSLNVGEQVKLSPDDDRPFLEPIPRKNKRYSVPNDSLCIPRPFSDGNISLKTEALHKELKDSAESIVNSFSTNTGFQNYHALKNDSAIIKDSAFMLNSLENNKPVIDDVLSHNILELDHKLIGNISENDNNFIQRNNKEDDSNRQSRLRTGHKRFSSLKQAIIEESESISPDEEAKKGLVVSLKNDEATLKNINNSSIQTSYLNLKLLCEPDQVGSRKLLSQGLKNSLSTQSLSSIASSTRSNPSTKLGQMNVRRAIANVVANSEYELSFSVGAILYELRPKNKEGLSFGILEDSNQGWYPSDAVEPYFIF